MTYRPLSFSLACALSVFALPSLANAQATAPTNTPVTAPAAPSAPVAPAATAPADTTASTERPDTYTIVQGDTLWSISHKFDTSIKALMKLNGLKKHAVLHIGQVLKIPPATADSSAK